jgi:hypothetical protein
MSAARRPGKRVTGLWRSQACLWAAGLALCASLGGGGLATTAAAQARSSARGASKAHCSSTARRGHAHASRPTGKKCVKSHDKGLKTRSGSSPAGPAPSPSNSPEALTSSVAQVGPAVEATPPASSPGSPAGTTDETASGSTGGSSTSSGSSEPEGSENPMDSEGPSAGAEDHGSSETEGSEAPSGSEDPSEAGNSGSSSAPEESSTSDSTETATPFRFFASTSFWNEPVPASAALDPRSAELAGAFSSVALAEIKQDEEGFDGPWIDIDTTTYSVPIYTVPATQPTVRVTLKGGKTKGLQEAWNAVPLPPNAQPAAGTDGHLVVWQPSTDKLWEFWRLVHGTEGWYASWGGAMQNVQSDPGVYEPKVWPGAQNGWGASACSLSIAGGLITLEDLKLGQINHALAVSIPNVLAGEYASPAQRSDGKSTSKLSLPEGAHLRLDPSLNLATLHLPHLILMMAEAAQKYGIFVRDNGPAIAFFAQDPIPTGSNPYLGASGYFEGKNPMRLLASFPWSHLQLLKMSLHSTS